MRNIIESSERVSEILQGQSPQAFLAQHTAGLRRWLEGRPEAWRLFGPYWGAVQYLMRIYQSDYAEVDSWASGEEFPDYLQGYMRGDDIIKWVDSLDYLNRNGDYVENPGTPHLVTLENGDQRLYDPLVGLLDR